MGLLDRLFGRRRQERYRDTYRDSAPGYTSSGRRRENLTDEQAIERYRYLLRTAPPEQIEQAHAEAFSQLTPDQRQQVLGQLAAAVPAGERPRTDDPQTLARVATRAELRQPGFLERIFGGSGPGYGPGYGGGYGPGYGRGGYGGGYRMGGPSFGSMVGGSLLGTIGGLVIGSAVADALFDTGPGDGGLFGGGDDYYGAQGDYGDQGGDYGGDPNADFAGGADNGWGDNSGGDYGDFGGGDFGGDFGGGGDF